jgi:hypothetical protein
MCGPTQLKLPEIIKAKLRQTRSSWITTKKIVYLNYKIQLQITHFMPQTNLMHIGKQERKAFTCVRPLSL